MPNITVRIPRRTVTYSYFDPLAPISSPTPQWYDVEVRTGETVREAAERGREEMVNIPPPSVAIGFDHETNSLNYSAQFWASEAMARHSQTRQMEQVERYYARARGLMPPRHAYPASPRAHIQCDYEPDILPLPG